MILIPASEAGSALLPSSILNIDGCVQNIAGLSAIFSILSWSWSPFNSANSRALLQFRNWSIDGMWVRKFVDLPLVLGAIRFEVASLGDRDFKGAVFISPATPVMTGDLLSSRVVKQW